MKTIPHPGTKPFHGTPWIKSPSLDLIFFILGWATIFLLFLCVDATAFKHEGRRYLLGFVLLLTVFHRQLTFPIVYGDPEQFSRRKKSYLALPLFFAVLTLGCLLYSDPPSWVSRKVSQNIETTNKDLLTIVTRDGGQSQRYKVPFPGTERSLQDVAVTIKKNVDTPIQVSLVEDRLRVAYPSGGSNSQLTIISGPDSQVLAERLGIAKGGISRAVAYRPLLFFLLVGALFWEFFHTLMQKTGILRIYSRKAGYGKAWLDKAMIWSWFAFVFFKLGTNPETVQYVSTLAEEGEYLARIVKPLEAAFPNLAMLALGVAAVITFLYVREEFRNRENFHWPKNLFLGSILALYSLLFYDFLVGYVVFAFSHAIEYLAFVNIFSRRKYLPRPATSSLMAKWVHHQAWAMTVFIAACTLVFIPWYYLSNHTLVAFILATSFLHFLYDGWIWKVRDPKVGQPLGIDYATPPKLQAA